MNNPLNYPHKKLGEDVTKFYQKYKNTTTVWKKTVLRDVSFILPEYYNPVQLSNLYIIYSWIRSIWCCCCHGRHSSSIRPAIRENACRKKNDQYIRAQNICQKNIKIT